MASRPIGSPRSLLSMTWYPNIKSASPMRSIFSTAEQQWPATPINGEGDLAVDDILGEAVRTAPAPPVSFPRRASHDGPSIANIALLAFPRLVVYRTLDSDQEGIVAKGCLPWRRSHGPPRAHEMLVTVAVQSFQTVRCYICAMSGYAWWEGSFQSQRA
ncbi:hypothetical protein SNOG_16210 [Parastagonospora nodorum SN15]|uniref:Uncharacterized protein n=1 Tax=Phaeosphaeria nodorum (strain SN15 / ATCC MYA-4574 / FGSC 10173) TaxID=321614 RepID=Q0TW86_PHANO|nr:hypothetical protein SNOG_16210 [Parastagonospora nodorum SN15]EAT76394.1 hypothetical protein SNOG_16210 [Parastagonospora nodorum SN15]